MRREYSGGGSLSRLSQEFGTFGPLSAQPEPWLTAELDQHAAAVRDSVTSGGGLLGRRSLAEYLHGFIEGCRERGWHSSNDGYDWETLRLLAICRLARDRGFVQ